ncbi:MAG TPA: dihydropteroate synthase [Candidatus Saccharimonadales bacterium]|nr:dihydropteroate synthase [Candidatus Saccharimonadales bacterium]
MSLPPLGPLLSADRGYVSTRHGKLDCARRTVIMGILNVTPDSFYDGGRRSEPTRAIVDGVEMVQSGAEVLDVGGESTRPGARPVDEAEELDRVLPVIRGLRREVAVPISIDTYKAGVARAALDAGADIVNDISALRFDPALVSLVAAEEVPVILMHMQGKPQTMQSEPRYNDVVREVRDFLAAQLYEAMDAGIAAERIILDPCIGFGKTLEHNLQLLRGLPTLAALGQPLLVGASRKAFIGKILDLDPDHRLEGSLAAAVAAVLGGANLLRVHDVAETCRAARMADAIRFGFTS